VLGRVPTEQDHQSHESSASEKQDREVGARWSAALVRPVMQTEGSGDQKGQRDREDYAQPF